MARYTYQEIMAHVSVDDAMASRVLARAEASARDTHARGSRLRLVPALVAAAAVLVLAVAVPRLGDVVPGGDTGPVEQGTYGLISYASLKELSSAVGFDVPELADLPFSPDQVTYESIAGNLAQVTYADGGHKLVFRMAPGTDDVSGDYDAYAREEVVRVSDVEVTLKGDAEGWALATWSDGTYAYALSSDVALSEDALTSLVAQTR